MWNLNLLLGNNKNLPCIVFKLHVSLGLCLSLTSVHQDPTVVQSRVRRLIGRRRAGLDCYASILSREASQPHDYDPITELLSQLSSGEWTERGERERREGERLRKGKEVVVVELFQFYRVIIEDLKRMYVHVLLLVVVFYWDCVLLFRNTVIFQRFS